MCTIRDQTSVEKEIEKFLSSHFPKFLGHGLKEVSGARMRLVKASLNLIGHEFHIGFGREGKEVFGERGKVEICDMSLEVEDELVEREAENVELLLGLRAC